MSTFFSRRHPGAIGMAMFLNAGDPSFEVLKDLVLLLDAAGVDCLELAVPFPNSISDGPVIQRSATRALQRGVSLGNVLAFVDCIRPRLRHLRIVLLADWSHTVKPLRLEEFLCRTADSGADALLIHGLPPRLRGPYYDAAGAVALPVITTCYASSSIDVVTEAAQHASAYVYLVAQYGRTGATPVQGYRHLQPLIRNLHDFGEAPIAVGFGIRTKAHLAALHEVGADAAIIGSAFVACLERALIENRDPLAGAETFLAELRGHSMPLAPVHHDVIPPPVAPRPSEPSGHRDRNRCPA